ncbi:MAG: hypothetical protein CFE43_05500 [Burkholderiales bacterium PBB3]|nr:MAG: hypothetical protein CFE43_05500 [Burkholderiales bacterium PBB3]
MLDNNFKAISKQLLERVCSEGWPESQTLDFKALAYGKSDDDKLELAKDVCAFANADGGDLVIGISEKSGSANTILGLTGETADQLQRRIQQTLDAKIEPRINGIRVTTVDVDGGFVLAMRVPASYDGPHCVRDTDSWRRFVIRNGTNTSDMTFDQVRSAFDRTATLTERVRQLIDSRLLIINAGKTWRPMMKGPACVVHVVPLSSMVGRTSVDVSKLHDDFINFLGDDWGGGSRTLNLDGLIVHPGGDNDDGVYAYNQVFRNGALEFVRFGGLSDGRKIVPSTDATKFYRDSLKMAFKQAPALGQSGPAIVKCALLNAEGFELGVGGGYHSRRTTLLDRRDIALPDAWVESLESVIDVDAIARPMMDVLWQSFDVQRCLEYREDGVWAPRG